MVQSRSNGETSITVLVQIVPGEGVHAKVIKPFIYSGIVSVDDGATWKNFDPHENVVRIERSPVQFEMPLHKRMDLIKKNFEVSLAEDVMVAGRAASVVRLHGLHKGMFDRVLKVDKESALILDYWVDCGQNVGASQFVTKSITLGESSEPSEFEFAFKMAKVVDRTDSLKEIKNPVEASPLVGFLIKTPTDLPAGLSLQAYHVISNRDSKFLGVRLTDGMSIVNAYLWKPSADVKRSDEPFEGKYDSVAPSGIKCRVKGEVPEWVAQEIAKAFARVN